MVQKLAIVAFTGLVVSAVAMGVAAAIGTQEYGKEFRRLDLMMFSDRPRCEKTGNATASSRTLNWDGSDEVSLNVPGRARYTPNGDNQMHVSGDPDAVARVRVRGGRIELDCRSGNWGDHALEITLPGKRFDKFSIAGSGKLQLENLDQRDLRVSIAGSGSITANGKADDVEISIKGSGDADLGKVQADDAKVEIFGSGNADIAPRGEAEIHIFGSGDVNLHTTPRNVETHIAGSGRIHNVGSGI